GRAPWPPAPTTRTSRSAEAAMSGPGRDAKTPRGKMPDDTCSPNATSTGRPAAVRTPSAIILPAPSPPSSPGWNMNTTSPAISCRRAHNSFAAPRSEEHTSELQSRGHLVCRLLLEKKKQRYNERACRTYADGRIAEVDARPHTLVN